MHNEQHSPLSNLTIPHYLALYNNKIQLKPFANTRLYKIQDVKFCPYPALCSHSFLVFRYEAVQRLLFFSRYCSPHLLPMKLPRGSSTPCSVDMLWSAIRIQGVNIHKTPTSCPSKAMIYTSERFQGLSAETAATDRQRQILQLTFQLALCHLRNILGRVDNLMLLSPDMASATVTCH